MQFVLICTEGNVSEPECLNALDVAFKGQAPQENALFVEVIPIPVGGNQGHVKLVEKSNIQVELTLNDDEQAVSIAGEEDSIEKWLVCDYDELDSAKISLEDLRTQAAASGFRLIISKPNFEFFVLALLIGAEDAAKVNEQNYKQAINAAIEKLNANNKATKNFSDSMMLPLYSKKKRPVRLLFGQLFQYNPELLKAIEGEVKFGDENTYTEMPELISALKVMYERPAK